MADISFGNVISGIVGSLFTAIVAYSFTIGLDNRRDARKRVAVSALLNTELFNARLRISDHHRVFEGYVKKSAVTGTTTKADWPLLQLGEKFSFVYEHVIPDIGLFDPETSSAIVLCYDSILRLLRDQDAFTSELDDLLRSSSSQLQIRAKNLYDYEAQLITQVEGLRSRLTWYSRPISFKMRIAALRAALGRRL
jgi:hypothetical protein